MFKVNPAVEDIQKSSGPPRLALIQHVAKLVKSFKLSGFWAAFFVGIFITLFSLLIEFFLPSQGVVIMHTGNTISI